MTPDELAAIKARANAATEGEWDSYRPNAAYRVHEVCSTTEHGLNETLAEVSGYNADADAEFIAHARTDALALLAEVERLAEAIAAWERGSYWAQKKIDRRTRERDALAAKIERVALLAHQVEEVPVHAGGGNLVTRRRMLPEDALTAALADPKEEA